MSFGISRLQKNKNQKDASNTDFHIFTYETGCTARMKNSIRSAFRHPDLGK